MVNLRIGRISRVSVDADVFSLHGIDSVHSFFLLLPFLAQIWYPGVRIIRLFASNLQLQCLELCRTPLTVDRPFKIRTNAPKFHQVEVSSTQTLAIEYLMAKAVDGKPNTLDNGEPETNKFRSFYQGE